MLIFYFNICNDRGHQFHPRLYGGDFWVFFVSSLSILWMILGVFLLIFEYFHSVSGCFLNTFWVFYRRFLMFSGCFPSGQLRSLLQIPDRVKIGLGLNPSWTRAGSTPYFYGDSMELIWS